MKVMASAKEELAAYVECMWGSMGWNTRLYALNIGRGARGGQQRLDGMSRGDGDVVTPGWNKSGQRMQVMWRGGSREGTRVSGEVVSSNDETSCTTTM